MSATIIYLIGFIVFTAGVAMAAHLAGMSQRWLTALVIVLLGIGITTAATRTRRPEPPGEEK